MMGNLGISAQTTLAQEEIAGVEEVIEDSVKTGQPKLERKKKIGR